MTAPDRPGAVSWDRPADFVNDPDRPLLVASPVAAERRGGRSLSLQADLDQKQRTPMSEYPKHAHEAGDRYVCIVRSIIGNEHDGFRIVSEAYVPSQGSIEQAWRKGLRELDRSDDFNLGVIRGGELVALLWHDEVVDDDPSILAEIAEECGL